MQGAVFIIFFGVLAVLLYYAVSMGKDRDSKDSAPVNQSAPVPPKPEDKAAFVFIDIETTGLNVKQDSVVQLSAIRFFEEEAIDGISTYINPGRPIPPAASAIHGIVDSMVQDAPQIDEVKDLFFDFIKDAIVVGYNVKFDLKFLDKAFDEDLNGIQYIDVLVAARDSYVLPDYHLKTVATHAGFVPETGYHNALDDCKATAHIFFDLHLENDPDRIQVWNSHSFEKPREQRTTEEPAYTMEAYRLWADGDQARINGDFERAFQLFEQARSAGFEVSWLFESYAKAYRKMKDYQSEVNILTEGLEKCSDLSVGILSDRLIKAQEKLDRQLLLEKELQEKALKKEQRRLQQELEKEKPKKPVGRAVAQCAEDGSIIRIFDTVTSAAKEIGVDPKGIRSAARGQQKAAGGFHWMYMDDQPNSTDHEKT